MKKVHCSLHDPMALSCADAMKLSLLVETEMLVAPVVRPEQPASSARTSKASATGGRRVRITAIYSL
jgi:hypothetical protein